MNDAYATLTSGGMRLRFYKTGDRFVHDIELLTTAGPAAVWRSIQASDDSPAFQELYEQTDDQGRVLLFLSGAAGGAHWSMSVHSDRDDIEFDVAARVTRPPRARAIEYRAAGGDPASISLTAEGTCRSELCEQAAGVRLEPAPTPDDELPQTLRWKYRAVASCGGHS